MLFRMFSALSLRLVFGCLFPIASSLAGVLGTGLEISLSGDMVYNQGLNQSSAADEQLEMRGAELMFYSPIDHQFDGVLSGAAHYENGETVFELHELIVSSSKIVLRSTIRVGQFFLGIGRLNRFHRHDWPFTRAPKVHRTFFDDEGVFDSGIEYSFLASTDPVIRLTGGLTSGHRYGHSHSAGNKPKVPTHYLRLSWFHPSSSTSGIELGTSYLGRTDHLDNSFRVIGLDLVAKKRRGRRVHYLVQSELWYRHQKNVLDSVDEQVGFYLFGQRSVSDRLSMGLRLDGHKELSKLHSITGKKMNSVSYGFLVQNTYHSSEFFKFRTSLSHEFDREEGVTLSKDTRVAAQFIFILGSHPAHDF